MKTSNRILLGLLVIIFAIPLLLSFSLQRKIKNGEYTVIKDENKERPVKPNSGSFSAFKVMKIVAPGPEFLTCQLRQSDTLSYSYYRYESADSIMVVSSNDTLYVKYITKKETNGGSQRRERNHLVVNVTMPALNNLVVDGATIVLDSTLASSGTLNITLKNESVVKDGSEKKEVKRATESPEVSMRKDNILPETGNDNAELKTGLPKEKFATIQHKSVEMLSVSLKDILIFHLLNRS